MTEESNGLRFDVYERVHLPVDVADIHELEEIELSPHIGVFHQDGQIILRGNLLLSGVYVSHGDGRESRTLEHWIPVEITLPTDRVSRPEEIAVDIENFDVDLLSARTLNITGVLSLKGVEMRRLVPPATWREEPFTVVHDRESRNAQGESETGGETQAVESQSSEPPIGEAMQQWPGFEAEEAPEAEAAGETVREEWSSFALQAESKHGAPGTQGEQADADAPGSERPPHTPAVEVAYVPDWNEVPGTGAAEGAFAAADSIDAAEPVEAQQEMKVAFGAKRPLEEPAHTAAGGLTKLIQTGKREQHNEPAAAKPSHGETDNDKRPTGGDEVQWKNLFLSGDDNERQFRRVRMCIVQRDESLDTIAGRYQLSPREILLYNRIEEHSVTVGQVLYIP